MDALTAGNWVAKEVAWKAELWVAVMAAVMADESVVLMVSS